jgi:hypothetical protein
MSEPYKIDLAFYLGTPFTDAFLLEADDVIESVVGKVLRMQIREYAGGTVLATWTSAAGQLEIGDADTSTFGFTLSSEDIADLSVTTALVYDLFADNDVLAAGTILVTRNITETA